MPEDALIMVCAACGGVEVFQQVDDDAWLNLTRTVSQHRAKNRACHAARQWVGTNLEDCPYPFAGKDGPVN